MATIAKTINNVDIFTSCIVICSQGGAKILCVQDNILKCIEENPFAHNGGAINRAGHPAKQV